MSFELKALIIDKVPENAAALNQALLPDIILSEFASRQNLLKAVQTLRDGEFDVCFVGEAFPAEDLTAFFADMRALKKHDETLFVQVRASFEEGFDRGSVEKLGYAAVVTRAMTDSDRIFLKEAIATFLHARELRTKKLDVESAVKLLLLELERVNNNKRRGVNSGFRRGLVSDFLSEQVQFHDSVFSGFIDALERQTEVSPPYKPLIVHIPESLQERNLPGMQDGTYVGVSLRVYEMLQEKFGVEKANEILAERAAATETPEEKGMSAEERLKLKMQKMGIETD